MTSITSDPVSPSRPITLAVFIDALGWRQAQQHGFLTDLLSWRQPLETVFGYSSTCDPTILTGVSPAEHDHFAFFRWDPDGSPFPSWLRWLRLIPAALRDRARVRHLLSRAIGWALDMRGYFNLYAIPFERLPLLDYTERRDIYRPGGIRGGQPTFFSELEAHGKTVTASDWRRGDAAALEECREAIENGPPDFYYLYLAELDAVMHRFGPDSAQATLKLDSLETEIRSLINLARRRGLDPRILVFSDHGMASVDSCCDLKLRIEATGARWGIDYAAIWDSTIARFWFFDEAVREQIVAILECEPAGQILDAEQLETWGCSFPGQRYGELFFLMRPGALLVPSDMGVRPVAGMHGYAPEHPDSTAALLADRPLLRETHSLADLAALFLAEVA